ncbi:SagB family peptide dehydrogenase [Pseudomonas sp. MH2]|uniref:SagB family peptide dehydrogenase n=1 Tax=Pseudomonas machongensis TaxID=3110229 RepID=A0ABU5V969_9PSED|nr:SagB family peptide dehydrogenase [Pseudomonas sp. MH2]MEA5669904.1 SagB family peptide dehydrogenase [Pseudomonas sp. MH2]
MNNDCFFITADKNLICWNYKNHKQYELSHAHARRLVDLIYQQDEPQDDNPLDQNLLRCDILNHQPADDKTWGWDMLSRIFHFGTKNIALSIQPKNEADWAALYLEHCESVLSKPLPAQRINLNALQTIQLLRHTDSGLFEALLTKRSTSRDFLDLPVQLEDLTRILEYSIGFIGERELPDSSNLPAALRKRRSSPSGGGLNSTEAYVYVRHVDNLDPGLYYYDPFGHCLHLLSTELPPVGKMLSGQHFSDSISAGFFLTSRFDKLWWKYEHSRAYRIALLEIGHVAQTLQLVATALNLDTWPTGALCEDLIDPLLQLNSPGEQVLFFVGCGHAKGSATPNSLKTILAQ